MDADSEVSAYDMSSDTWSTKSNFPYDSLWRASAGFCNQNGDLVFGRSPSNEHHNEFFKYHPSDNSWDQPYAFPGPDRVYLSLSALMGKLIVTCGLDSIGDSKNDMWQYDTLTGIWHQLFSIPAIERRGGIAFTSATSLY